MGRMVHYLPTCHSTNDYALQLLQKSEVKSGSIVISDYQSKGRGQRGNGWESEEGMNLLFSLILKPAHLKANEQFRLNILISNALVSSIHAVSHINAKVKWPNDILFKEQKLAGILIESVIQGTEVAYSVAGMGININQKLFETKGANSLSTILGRKINRSLLLEAFLEELERTFLPDDESFMQNQKGKYIENLFGFREWRTYEDVDGRFEGRIVGITELGEVLIEREKGLNKYQMKEFRYIFESREI